MAVNLRKAVEIDRKLHGERFIQVEFIAAILLMLFVDGFIAKTWIRHPNLPLRWLLLTICIFVFFSGELVNYAVLLWVARSPLPDNALPESAELRSLTRRLSGWILVPGALAVLAWHQRKHP